jgi:hypothetical protein
MIDSKRLTTLTPPSSHPAFTSKNIQIHTHASIDPLEKRRLIKDRHVECVRRLDRPTQWTHSWSNAAPINTVLVKAQSENPKPCACVLVWKGREVKDLDGAKFKFKKWDAGRAFFILRSLKDWPTDKSQAMLY